MLLPNARTIDVREIYGFSTPWPWVQVSRMIYGIGARDKCIPIIAAIELFCLTKSPIGFTVHIAGRFRG